MRKNELAYKTGLAPESMGIAKIMLWGDDLASVEGHSGIADVRSECIKIMIEKRILAIFGENLTVKELDGYNLKIKGKIFRIEYLT